MALLSQANKLIVVLVVVIALLALLVGVFIGGPLATISLDTTTHTQVAYGVGGCGLEPNGELLDASQYVTSWSTTGASEKIVMAAGVTPSGGVSYQIPEMRYKVETSSNGLTWNEVKDSPINIPLPQAVLGPGCHSGTVPPYTIVGPFTGGIRVTLLVHILDWKILDRGFIQLAQDEAYLIPGVGKINAPAQAQVGDKISVTTIVGYVTSDVEPNKGWQFWGYSRAQAKTVVGPVQLTELQQSFSYTLVSADFSVSAGCNTPNRIEWHLLNELFEKDFSFTTTIDISKLAPSLDLKGYTGDPVNGGNVTLQFKASPNPVTQFPITKVVIAYGFGGISNEVNLTGNATSAPVPLGQSGNLHVEAYAVDSACRPSASQRIDIAVREPGQNNEPGGKPNWLVFGLILVVFVIAAAVIAYAWKGGPIWARLLVLAVVILVGLLVAIVVVPQVLNPAVYLIRMVVP